MFWFWVPDREAERIAAKGNVHVLQLTRTWGLNFADFSEEALKLDIIPRMIVSYLDNLRKEDERFVRIRDSYFDLSKWIIGVG